MIDVNEKYAPIMSSDSRYYIVTGGRGSGKSYSINLLLVLLTYEEGHTILFTRFTLSSAYISIIPEFIDKIETLYAIYKQVIDVAEVSFEGEPLNGLQIMGVLESRVLDFETVIITSLNEGKLPAGKSQNSFIPYDVKRELELPTFKEKDAIYTYHFYHLLQRAKTLTYFKTTKRRGWMAGKKIRFQTMLQ